VNDAHPHDVRRHAEPEIARRIEHGGGLDAARRRFPDAPEPWIDLSTGVSPFPYPLPPIAPQAWSRLPDADALIALEAAAARAYGAPRGLAVVAGAGTQAFIQSLPRAFPGRRVAILGFTYAEHRAAWSAAGAHTEMVASFEELAAADIAIAVNPNNPDGRLVSPGQLIQLADRLAEHGGVLIVDEAFMDIAPEASMAPMAGGAVIVLRSFGKIYGLPGVRLGFAICEPLMAARLRAELGPWSVSGPALAIGTPALSDSAWLERSRAALKKSARRLDELLQAAGFEILGEAALFTLAARSDAEVWFERLAKRGILTRRFEERPSWLRFGLPAEEEHWTRLREALGLPDVR
jgi:cobalamin biosynthesis protein CobC